MSRLLKNSGWSLLAQGGKVLTQAGLFVLLARGFGVDDFGLYMAVFAICQLFYPFSGLGTHNTLVMRVSRSPKLLAHYFWTPIVTTLVVGGTVGALLSLIISYGYASPIAIIAAIVVTELVAYRLLDAATHAWQSVENLRNGSLAYLSVSVARLALAALLFFSGLLNISSWAFSNLMLTLVMAVLFIAKVVVDEDVLARKIRFYPREVFRGIYFSFSGGSQAINANVDKIVLSRMVPLGDVGVYSAAYRVIQMGLLPVMAVLQASYPRFFKAGKAGLEGSLGMSRKLAPFLLAYGVLATLLLILVAPYVPFFLGEEYEASVFYIQLLAPLPLLQVMHYLLGEAMTGAGYQRQRAMVQIGVGIGSIFLNIVLVAWLGIPGAVIAVLVAELALFCLYWIVIMKHSGGLLKKQCESIASS